MSGQFEFTFDSNIISDMKYYQYMNIACHMFKWTNLPPGLDGERLEMMLIERGSVAFFNAYTGFYILPYSSSGLLDVYGNLTNAIPVPKNGEQLELLDDLPRILWDNATRQPFRIYLRAFADRLAHIQKSISIMERNARKPRIMAVNELNKENYERFESKIDDGYPVIFVDQALFDASAPPPVQVFDTGFDPVLFQYLWQDYNKVEGEIYNMLGTMFNVEQNKAAGVGQAETMVNYAQTFALAASRLEQRQRWCDKLNDEGIGGGIWCEKATDLTDIMSEMMNDTQSTDVTQAKEIKGAEDDSDNAR